MNYKSAWFACSKPAYNSSVGRFSPKLIIVSWREPLHAGFSHNLPVSCECVNKSALAVLKSRRYFLPHF